MTLISPSHKKSMKSAPFKPIKLGFDLSIVSGTKYYSGHSDVMGGSLAVSQRVFRRVLQAHNMTGLRLSPDDAYLIMRGLRTLDVRLDKHQENTNRIARFLSQKKILKFCTLSKKTRKIISYGKNITQVHQD